MPRSVWPVVAVALLVTLLPATGEAQSLVAQRICQGTYQGAPLQGRLILERWSTQASYRYYGVFQDGAGNVYELEVMTPDLGGGIGSTWTNGMRHRETYIRMQVFEKGFVVATEDGITVAFECEEPPPGRADRPR